MNGARLLTLLPTLHTRRPLTVIGAAVIDIIADAWTLPRR
ncbi:TPA: sugar kinase, partial [Salmonella enterica]|nr:sugar kinase [Salmonella enterica]